jgi:hypothetical protein
MRANYRDNTLSSAKSLNVTSDTQSLQDWVGRSDTIDFYSFNLSGRSSFNLSLSGLTANADVQLIRDANSNGQVDTNEIIAGSYKTGKQAESIQTTLDGGNYLIKVYSAGGSTNYKLGVSAKPTTADWTFMVYLDADNNLENFGIQDFLEMAKVGSTANVNIVVQMDRISGYDSRYDNWTDTRRGLVRQWDKPGSSWGASIGEANMGAQSTLSDFMNWSMTNYKANNYALVLWNHGGGYDGICWDDSNQSDRLELKEISAALANLSDTVDVVGADACLMGMTEFAYQIRNHASVMVAAEELTPGQGWNYTRVLSDLTASSKMTAAEFGSAIVKGFGDYYGALDTGVQETLSAIDLVKLRSSNPNNLSNALSQFATTFMNVSTSSDRTKLDTYRASSVNFGDGYYPGYRDLGSILAGVINDITMTSMIRDAALMVLGAYDSLIISNYSADGRATGLAINFQARGKSVDGYYNSSNLDFAADTTWDEFLRWWQTA